MRVITPRFSLNIYAKILLVVLAPLTTMIALFGYFFIESRLEDVKNIHSERGSLVARNLAVSSEFSVFSGDSTTLQTLIDTLVDKNRDVDSAALLDRDLRILAQSTDFRMSDLQRLTPSGVQEQFAYTLFMAPIGTSLPVVSDFQEEIPRSQGGGGGLDDATLGWAVICLSTEKSLETRRAVLSRSTFTIALSLLISILLSITIGKSITRRIHGLVDTVDKLGEGKLFTRVRAPSNDEFGGLERGFNRMADALESSQETLHQRVSDATFKLQETVDALREKNEALRIASREAMNASQEKAEFLARMSHEIRTPLNAVIGFSRIIKNSEEIEKARGHALTIDRAANQLLYVVDGILDFSRLEAGKIELESLQFDLIDHLENSAAMMSFEAHAKGLELILHLHNDLPETVWGDPHRLNQVLTNLISNAIKFTKRGHVCVEASFEYTQDLDGRLTVRVSDTGAGMTSDEQERLFRPFVQADSSITRRYGGTGLGLSIAKYVVSLMKGEIKVFSEKGVGSTFEFSIPCSAESARASIDAKYRLKEKTGLIFDRNPVARRAIISMLVETGATLFSRSDSTNLWNIAELRKSIERKIDFIVAGISPADDDHLVESLEAAIEKGFDLPVLLLVAREQWNPPKLIDTSPSVRWSVKPARPHLLHEDIVGLLRSDDSITRSPESTHSRIASLRSRHPAHVLFAEDNEFNRQYLRSVLEDLGIRVAEASTGEEAIKKVAEQHFDLIFLDIHMPVMDGIEICRRIRQQLGTDAPPIIALTADLFFDSHFAAERELFDDRLFKPIMPESLNAVLTNRIGNLLPLASPRSQTQAPANGPDGKATETPGLLLEDPPNLPGNLSTQLVAELKRLGNSLTAAYAASAWPEFAAASHQFHGLVTLYGQETLTEIADDFERAVRTASWNLLETRIGQFARLIDSLGDDNNKSTGEQG